MRKVLGLLSLLVMLSGLISGCGGAADTAPPKVDEATAKKKAEEAQRAAEEGAKNAPKGQPPH